MEGTDFVDVVNGAGIAGANTATLTLSSVAFSAAGDYRCVVTGGCGSVTSDAATLSVSDVTTIAQQPASRTVCEGSSATFAVAATGGGLSFRWQKRDVQGADFNDLANGGRISGADTATLTVSGVTFSDAGAYRCVVTGGCGSATSDAATLAVNRDTVITAQPTDQAPVEGPAVFSVSASGTGPLSYQWQYQAVGALVFSNISDDGSYSGATSPTLTVVEVFESTLGTYRCVVSGPCGTAVSNSATLTVP